MTGSDKVNSTRGTKLSGAIDYPSFVKMSNYFGCLSNNVELHNKWLLAYCRLHNPATSFIDCFVDEQLINYDKFDLRISCIRKFYYLVTF